MRLCQAIRANRFFSHHWRRHDCMYQRRWTSRLVSAKRMRDFFEAEVTHFSTMPGEVLNLEYLLTAASCPHLAATCIYDEIPKRFAKRIRQIEMLDGWDQDSSLQQLHECYVTSFQEIRMAEIKSHDLASLAEFTKTVRRLKERQKPVLSLLGKACAHKIAEDAEIRPKFWNNWLSTFLKSRVSTEMLTSQYLEVVTQTMQGVRAVTGIVDPNCEPLTVCQQAAHAARQICLNHLGLEPHVTIEVRAKMSTHFSFIPQYLHFILLEVLKNSCAATTQAAFTSTSIADPSLGIEMKKINVVICCDNHRIAVRISDLAGGIPSEVGDRVWDYLYAGPAPQYGDAGSNPLRSFGLGLPHARLYAEFLGGSLTLRSLPAYGTDTYLFLPRIDISPFLPDDSTRSVFTV